MNDPVNPPTDPDPARRGSGGRVSIRTATREDAATLLGLIHALADHEGQRAGVGTSVEVIQRDGHGATPRFAALLAEVDGRVVGFASYTWNYSIWAGGEYMNVDDVFVDDAQRGQGVGEALMRAARDLCRVRGVRRMRWEAEAGNDGGTRFYERLGARRRAKNVFSWDV